MVKERRRFQRMPVNQRGFVVLAGHQPPAPCAVRELSPGGARLHLAPEIEVPAFFELLLGATELVRCRLVHRTGSLLGAEFVHMGRA